MKRRGQSRNRKTLSKTDKTTPLCKKTSDDKKAEPICQKDHRELVQESYIELDTCQETQQKQIEQETTSHFVHDQMKSSVVESEENFMIIDPAIMEEIEKEIYESEIGNTISPIEKLKTFDVNDCSNRIKSFDKLQDNYEIEDQNQDKTTDQVQEKTSLELQNKLRKKISDGIQNISHQSEEDSIVVPQKTNPNKMSGQSTLTFSQKSPNKNISKNKPHKKIKSNSEQKNKTFLNFTIDLKLLRSNLSVKKIIKCLESKDIYDRWGAKFLIETSNGERQVLRNDEMVCFYKEILIEYYQCIHFS